MQYSVGVILRLINSAESYKNIVASLLIFVDFSKNKLNNPNLPTNENNIINKGDLSQLSEKEHQDFCHKLEGEIIKLAEILKAEDP